MTSADWSLDRELGCVFQWWATADEMNITLYIAQDRHGNQVEEGEYYGLVLFSSIVRKVTVFPSNIESAPSTEKLAWLHRLYINRFTSANGEQLTFEHDSSDYATDDN